MYEARRGTVGHEPDGGAAPNGPTRDHHARVPLDLPRLVRRIGRELVSAGGVRARFGAQSARQGRGSVPPRRYDREAQGAHAGLGRLFLGDSHQGTGIAVSPT